MDFLPNNYVKQTLNMLKGKLRIINNNRKVKKIVISIKKQISKKILNFTLHDIHISRQTITKF